MKNLVLAICMFWGAHANAEVIPELQEFAQQEIDKLALAQPLNEGGELAAEGDYELSSFQLRIKADFGFDVADSITLSVIPIIELIWK